MLLIMISQYEMMLRKLGPELTAAKRLAVSERKSGSAVISALARQAVRTATSSGSMRNGVPLLPIRPDAPRVTLELVRQLQAELV